MVSALIPHTTVTEIVGCRDAALARAEEGAALIARGHALLREARKLGEHAHGPSVFLSVDFSRAEAYTRLFQSFDPEASVEAFRRQVDARTWSRLMVDAGIQDVMDRTAAEKFRRDMTDCPPPVSEETVRGMLLALLEDRDLIFKRGLARVFSSLDRRFKSHDAFKLGARIILGRIFDEHGYWNYSRDAEAQLADVEKVLAVLDGAEPDAGALVRAVNDSRKGWGPRQGYSETPYLRIRTFKNGNAHLWFKRDDLVERANLLLAEFYGKVLPDAVPSDVDGETLRSSSGALSKDLAFYPTPKTVVDEALKALERGYGSKPIGAGSHVLEPSAGEGGMVRALLERGARVEAVEVHPARARTLELLAAGHRGLRVVPANFLRLPARPVFTHVVMNPPFCGVHCLEHVRHAFDFLAPGGALVAVLPVSADLGTTKKHQTFRAWAAQHTARHWGSPDERWQGAWTDLPQESFAASGTRVSTGLLVLHKDAR